MSENTSLEAEASEILEAAEKAGAPTVYMGQEWVKKQDAVRAVVRALRSRDEVLRVNAALRSKLEGGKAVCVWRPESEWHEDMGDVIWAHLPVCEPYYIGTPLSSTFQEYHDGWLTHFISLDCVPTPPQFMKESKA